MHKLPSSTSRLYIDWRASASSILLVISSLAASRLIWSTCTARKGALRLPRVDFCMSISTRRRFLLTCANVRFAGHVANWTVAHQLKSACGRCRRGLTVVNVFLFMGQFNLNCFLIDSEKMFMIICNYVDELRRLSETIKFQFCFTLLEHLQRIEKKFKSERCKTRHFVLLLMYSHHN